MKSLLTITALLELATGLALFAMPSLPASLLLGASLDAPSGIVFARAAGAALLALGTACWLARSSQSKVMVAAMLLYNLSVTAVLLHAVLVVGLFGIGLWPAIVLHLALAGWCVTHLIRREA